MAGLIDPRSVEVFYWVVRLGGFRRAAEKLATAQPAVSARIAGLEAAVGARLLERGAAGRRVGRASLTPQGLLMLSYAERLLALQAEMTAAFTGPGAVQGIVRLGVAETIVHSWLPALVRRLHDAYPLLELEIIVDVSTRLRAALLAGEVDVALLLGPVAAPLVQDAPLCALPLAWVARPDLVVGAEPLDLAALARFPIITYARQTAPYQEVRALFAGVAGVRIFANASVASIVRMVLDGIGIGVIASAVIQAELADGTLRLLTPSDLVAGRPAPLRFTASWREGPGSALASTVARIAQGVSAG
jgi:DNA-binding transcriptional LysR family regulator